jgi:tetratricopeptide (TPR) repeat protein
VFSKLTALFSSPTPLASLVSGLLMLALLAALYTTFDWLRGRREPGKRSIGDGIIDGLRWLDRALVQVGSWLVGTRIPDPALRPTVVVSVFSGFALGGALAPWPWGLAAIAGGVFAILIVFRHWSRDEDEVFAEIPFDQKDIRIRGDLSAEVMLACGFVLVFAPVAFSHLQAHGYGFEVAPDAGPFTFLIYSLVELFKAAVLLEHYDLFGDRIGYDDLTGVTNPSDHAKWAVLAYRVSLILLTLAAFKRLLDIARRRAYGLDLRHIEDSLRNKDPAVQKEAIADLKTLALAGRGNAQVLLERILSPAKSDDWVFKPEVRVAAANALWKCAERRGSMGALYAAIEGYRQLLARDVTRATMPAQWALTQNDLGNALQTLGEREGSQARLAEAVTAFRAALEVHTRVAMPVQWAMTQNHLGLVLLTLGEREGSPARLAEAVAACRLALDVYTRDETPAEWAMTQNNLGISLQALGEREGSPTRLTEAVTAFRAALEVRTRKAMPSDWAAIQNNLAAALQTLGEREGNSTRLKEAVAACRAALEVRTRQAMPADWAASQNNLGTVLQALGEREGSLELLNESIAAFRAALEVRTRADVPILWARTQNNLGNALGELGMRERNQERLMESIAAFRASLQVFEEIQASSYIETARRNLARAEARMTGEREKQALRA